MRAPRHPRRLRRAGHVLHRENRLRRMASRFRHPRPPAQQRTGRNGPGRTARRPLGRPNRPKAGHPGRPDRRRRGHDPLLGQPEPAATGSTPPSHRRRHRRCSRLQQRHRRRVRLPPLARSGRQSQLHGVRRGRDDRRRLVGRPHRPLRVALGVPGRRTRHPRRRPPRPPAPAGIARLPPQQETRRRPGPGQLARPPHGAAGACRASGQGRDEAPPRRADSTASWRRTRAAPLSCCGERSSSSWRPSTS